MTEQRTSGERVRDLVLDEMKDRLLAEFEEVEGGPLDGIAMLSKGKFEEIWQEYWAEFEMPLPTENVAEAMTPARVALALVCPECREPVAGSLRVNTVLTAEGQKRTLKAKATTTAVDHVHGQISWAEGDEVGSEEAFPDIDQIEPHPFAVNRGGKFCIDCGLSEDEGEHDVEDVEGEDDAEEATT